MGPMPPTASSSSRPSVDRPAAAKGKYYTEQTAITDRNDYPTAFWGWRTGTTAATTSTPSNTVQCFLTQVASRTCAQDSVTSYNLHEDPEATPYGTGYRKQHGRAAARWHRSNSVLPAR